MATMGSTIRSLLRTSVRSAVGGLAFVGLRAILLDRNEQTHGPTPSA